MAEPENIEEVTNEAEIDESQEAAVETEAEVETAEEQVDDASRIEQLEEDLAKAKDQALRITAEMQNIRRRAEKDVEKAHKFGNEKIAGDLLPVVDNLDRSLDAMDSEDEAIKPLREGIELTAKLFAETLAKHQILQVDPQGESFDPQLHQAMSMQESADVEPNTVIAVMQKGYTLNGRLIRPAMVMVSKAVPEAPSVDEEA